MNDAKTFSDVAIKLSPETVENINFHHSKNWKYDAAEEQKNFSLSDLDCDNLDKYSNSKETRKFKDDNVANLVSPTSSENVSMSPDIVTQIGNGNYVTANRNIKKIMDKIMPVAKQYKRSCEDGFESASNLFKIVQPKKTTDQDKSVLIKISEKLEQKSIRNDDETDSDSLHSIDTARYILSSKKHVGVPNRHAPAKTMIKSYRLIESKRNELRKKYAHLIYDDREKLMGASKCKPKNQSHQELIFAQDSKDGRRNLVRSHRMKRKRLRRQCHTSYSTSDEEDLIGTDSMGQKICQNSNHKECCCCGKKKASSNMCQHYNCRAHYSQRIGDNHSEKETEFACNKSNKLSGLVRHLINSASGDWVVENCDCCKVLIPRQEKSKIFRKGKRFIVETNNKIVKSVQKYDKAIKQRIKDKIKTSYRDDAVITERRKISNSLHISKHESDS